jgi:hypothetical protein
MLPVGNRPSIRLRRRLRDRGDPDRPLLHRRGSPRGIINRVAPEGRHLEVAYELAAEVAKNPPLSVRATVRTRRWYMDQLEREVTMQTMLC